MRFGEMLRQARAAKEMTQAELGAGVYSTHYISLLERGQRQPTAEMVQHFATQLGMDEQTLTWWVEPPAVDNQPALTAAMFAANYARDLQDHALAASEAEYAASIAHEQRNPAAWWIMSMLHAQSLLSLRRLDEAEVVLLRMDTNSLLVPTPELAAATRGRLSQVARGLGRISDAIALGREAVELADALPPNSTPRLQAVFILIAALAVKGDHDEAWNIASSLDLHEGTPSVPSLLIARGAWAIGNVALRRGDVEIGLAQHALAARLFLPQADFITWCEFHLASANHKLLAGIVDDSVRASLKNAENGMHIVSNPVQRLELTLAQAHLALSTGEIQTAGVLLSEVQDHRELLDFESTTEFETFLGRYHADRKSRKRAIHHFSEAARLYSEAGADEKAIELMDRVRTL